jgi:Nitric oxide synthase, oxygenase domain
MDTDVVRELTDPARYNLCKPIASAMGLDTRADSAPLLCTSHAQPAISRFCAAFPDLKHVLARDNSVCSAHLKELQQLPRRVLERVQLTASAPKRAGTLWKDKAVHLLNEAVMSSFTSAGWRIEDHHTVLAEFTEWYKKEKAKRGYCPGAHPLRLQNPQRCDVLSLVLLQCLRQSDTQVGARVQRTCRR